MTDLIMHLMSFVFFMFNRAESRKRSDRDENYPTEDFKTKVGINKSTFNKKDNGKSVIQNFEQRK